MERIDRRTHHLTHRSRKRPGTQPPWRRPWLPMLIVCGCLGKRLPGGPHSACGRWRKAKGRGRFLCHGLSVYRTCCPPANGVENSETDADRPHSGGIAAGGYVLFEDPDQRVGFGTSDGTRKQVECQCCSIRPADTLSFRRISAPSSSRYHRPDETRQQFLMNLMILTSTPCCCRSCGIGSSCRCGP